MSDAKTCPECRATTDPVLILCGACGSPLEGTLYLRFIYGTSLAAIGADVALWKLSFIDRFSVPLAFQLEAALLLVAYPLFKLLTKLRDPRRRVASEMGSAFSSRYDRALVTGLIALVVLIGLGVMRLGGLEPAIAPGLGGAKAALNWFNLLGGLIAAVAMIRDQGLRFFDFRVRNTYQGRKLDPT